jgi:drug/metabolite transporter (DMT)-like permease
VTGVVVGVQGFGLVFLFFPVVLAHIPVPPVEKLFWGGMAGLSGTCGVVALYVGLARGPMGVVAPVAAVVTALVPVVVGAGLEGAPRPLKYAGFGLAVMAIWLMAGSSRRSSLRLRHLTLPVLAGLGFSGFFVLIDRAGETATFWPLIAARSVSLPLIILAGAWSGRGFLPLAGELPHVLAAAFFETAGNIFFVLAARYGRLDTAAVMGSLYPAATVLLARCFLNEKLNRRQWLGSLAAMAAVVMIAA